MSDESTMSVPWLPACPSTREPFVIEITRGARCGEFFVVEATEYVLGRGSEATLRIVDSGVSRVHAKLVRLPEGIVNLIDLGSHNGTAVNGVRVDVAILRSGDRISLGPRVELRFGPRAPVTAPSRPACSAAWLRDNLTARQLQIARLVAAGQGNREIAAQLGLRVRSVESHLDRIYARLEIRSRAWLTRLIVEAGLA